MKAPKAPGWRLTLDLNELLRQHQIALINADSEPCTGVGCGSTLVRHYERRIADLRAELGVRQY